MCFLLFFSVACGVLWFLFLSLVTMNRALRIESHQVLLNGGLVR